VQLHPEGRLVHVAEFGTPCAGLALHAVPLVHSGMVLGELVLSVRAKGDTFGARDAALLSDLAQHMGVVAFALLMHNNLQQARQRLAHSREDERRKVQRDLHDGLGQQLGGLLLMLGVAQKQMAHKPDAVAPLLSDLQAMTTDIVSELRDMLAQLRPPLLQQYGFATGLRQLVSQSQQAVPNLCIHAHICDGLPALPSPIEVAAYRIVQEALNNVLKHANATRCNVSVSTCDQTGCLWLRISDDGVGAGAQGVGNGTGLGLQTMRERAEELGGRFSMSQPPQGGTLVEVWFDLRAV
jgi:signal transduction histidine kinase